MRWTGWRYGGCAVSAPLSPEGAEDEISPFELPLIPLLPSAITPPNSGADVFASLAGAEIIQIGTTTPGLIEGGGLIIDYRRPDGCRERLVLAFSERGMWVEYRQAFVE